MFATLATYASPRLNQSASVGAPQTRAVAPTPPAPRSNERPRPAPMSSASVVALAPAAMSALIEAQEQMAGEATVLDREQSAAKIERLISRLDDGDPPPPPADASLTVRRLRAARDRLL